MCTHEHAPEQGMVALHRPLHTPINPGLLCNCRAETVPAHRTVKARAAKSVALIFLPMIALLSSKRAADAMGIRFSLICRLGCNEPAYARVEAGLEDASAAQNVGAGLCLAAEMVLASCVLSMQ